METKKRLIDANAFEFEPDENGIANGIWVGGKRGGKTMSLILHSLKHMIDSAPTVDAVEVFHGRWERIGEKYENCPNCGTIFEALPTQFAFEMNNKYCRYCGAKMDGDGNG